MLRLTKRCCRWTIALVLVITVLLTAQLLRHSKNPDAAIIPPDWQDWVTSHWKGGDHSTAGDAPAPDQPQVADDKAVEKPAEDAAKQEQEKPKVDETTSSVAAPTPAPTTKPSEGDKTPVTTPAPASTSLSKSKKPWPWQKTKSPSAAAPKDRPSPTAAYEMLETQVPPPPDFDATKQMFDLNGPPEHDPAGPRPDQIVILTATDGGGHNQAVQDIMDKALHNRREYCEHHGYINHFVNMSRLDIPNVSPVWKKLPAIIETFQTYPDALWVWWLDLDAILMTLDFKIEERILSDAALAKVLLPHEEFKKSQQEGFGLFTAKKPDVRKADLLIAQDQSTMNAGSFMLRRSAWTQMMLDVWRDPLFMSHGFPMEEQDALIHITKTNPEIRAHVGLVGMRTLNEYLFGFHAGDLVVHFAGCWVEDHCQMHWDTMWKQRYGSLDWPIKENNTASEGQKDKKVEKRMARRAARGEMNPVEQLARGYYG